MEKVTIIIDVRDRFSLTTKCLETLFANTPSGHGYLVVLGGAPEHLRKEWLARFGGRARFIFQPEFLNQAQARNIGLRAAKTRLAVLMDNDNFVRPGWLEPLIRCQKDTGSALVVPVILETPMRIHTAGNDLYVVQRHGKAWGHKILRFAKMHHHEGVNLKRQPTAYAELHCQLVEVEPTLRLRAYDEAITEVGEVDQGMVYAKAGLPMWFEPESVVHYAFGSRMTADDIRLFVWRWDMRRVLAGYQHFERKWNMDITESGRFRDWLLRYNGQVGLFARAFPSETGLALDRAAGTVGKALEAFGETVARGWRAPGALARRLHGGLLGYNAWPGPVTD